MANKKRQHYVPKFYLKNFAADVTQKSINLFNIPAKKYITNAPIKNQAYSDYFYGKDAIIENALQDIENIASVLIRNCLKDKSLPAFDGQDHFSLLTFVIFQSARTTYQAEMANEVLDKMVKNILRDHPALKDSKDSLENITISHNSPAAYVLSLTARILPIAIDLKYKLVINNTKIPFITSDNPVVKYNQFMVERKRTPGGITGLGVKGLEIFLPIDARNLLVFYDSNIYRMGNNKDVVIETNNEKDINNLNILQLINADRNIYFNNECREIYINKIFEYGKGFFRNHKANLTEYKHAWENNRKLVQITEEIIKFKFKLSFIKELKKARSINVGNALAQLRSPALYYALKEDTDESKPLHLS